MLRIFNAFWANSHCGVRADVVIGPYNDLFDKPEFDTQSWVEMPFSVTSKS